MSRFFKAQVPVLGTDFMTQFPVELAAKAIMERQKAYDTNLKDAATLLGQLSVPHLDTEFDKNVVRQVQDELGTSIDEITKELMADPNARVRGKIQQLGTKINKELTTGNLAKVKGRYDAVQAWKKANEKMQTEDPYLFNLAYNSGMRRLMDSYSRKGHDASWGEMNIMENIDWSKEAVDVIKELEPEMRANNFVNVGNQWIYKGKESDKYLSQNRILKAVENKIKSNPKFASYVQQRGSYGLPGYLDENGAMEQMFIQDDKGNLMVNPRSAFAPTLKMSEQFAFLQSEKGTTDVSENGWTKFNAEQAAINRRHRETLEAQKLKETVAIAPFHQYNMTDAERANFTNNTIAQFQSMSSLLKIPAPTGKNGAPPSHQEVVDWLKKLDMAQSRRQVDIVLNGAGSTQEKIKTNNNIQLTRNLIKSSIENLETGSSVASLMDLAPIYHQRGLSSDQAVKQLSGMQETFNTVTGDPSYLQSTPGIAQVKVYDKNGNLKQKKDIKMTGFSPHALVNNISGLDSSLKTSFSKAISVENGYLNYMSPNAQARINNYDPNSPTFYSDNKIGRNMSVDTENGRIDVTYVTDLGTTGVEIYNNYSIQSSGYSQTPYTPQGVNLGR